MAEEVNDGLIVVSSDSPEPQETPGAPSPDQEPGSPAESPPAPEPSDDDDAPESVSPRELRRLVGRMTAQRTAMERELGATRAQVETLMKLIQPAQQEPEPSRIGPPKRPRPSEYATEEAYDAAEERYHTDMVDYRLAEREAGQRQQHVAQTQAEQDARRVGAIRAREAEILKVTPDYYDRFERIGPTLAPQVLWALQQAGAHGPDLVLHLSAHPEEITRLNEVPAHLIGVELGMLRGGTGPRTSAPSGSPSHASRLPEPPQPVNGSGATVQPGYRDDFTQEQYDAWVKRTYPSMPYTWRR
jgi:hypothetical protein